jgi:hypothetical protein
MQAVEALGPQDKLVQESWPWPWLYQGLQLTGYSTPPVVTLQLPWIPVTSEVTAGCTQPGWEQSGEMYSVGSQSIPIFCHPWRRAGGLWGPRCTHSVLKDKRHIFRMLRTWTKNESFPYFPEHSLHDWASGYFILSWFQLSHLWNGTNHVLLLSCKYWMRECPWMHLSENKTPQGP